MRVYIKRINKAIYFSGECNSNLLRLNFFCFFYKVTLKYVNFYNKLCYIFSNLPGRLFILDPLYILILVYIIFIFFFYLLLLRPNLLNWLKSENYRDPGESHCKGKIDRIHRFEHFTGVVGRITWGIYSWNIKGRWEDSPKHYVHDNCTS